MRDRQGLCTEGNHTVTDTLTRVYVFTYSMCMCERVFVCVRDR